MKTFLTLFFITLAFAASAQLSTNQKTQVTSMIATAVSKLQVEIKWLRDGKKTDSIRINNLIISNSNMIARRTSDSVTIVRAKATIDSLKKVIPPTYKTYVGEGIIKDVDTMKIDIEFIRKALFPVAIKSFDFSTPTLLTNDESMKRHFALAITDDKIKR